MRYLFALAAIALLLGCEPKAKGTSSSPLTSKTKGDLELKEKFPFNTPKRDRDVSGDVVRGEMIKLVKLRQREMKEDLFDITYYFLTPRGFDNLGERKGPQSFIGMWARFNKNYTYEYGLGEKVVGSGIFHQADSDQFLLMVDDDPRIEPKMWTLLSNSEFFNFLGRPIIIIEVEGIKQILMENFAKDSFLDTQKVLYKVQNGMQLMMSKAETKPKALSN